MPKVALKCPQLLLHKAQFAILSDRHRFKVIAAGRRFGKTLLAMEWLTLAPGGAAEGKPVAIFAPTYKLLLEVWADIERTLRPLTRRINRAEMRIELINGGSIDGWTLERPDAGRGRKYARVVIDEAAHARHLKDAWEHAIAPTLTDLRGEAWFISTPAGLNFFWELYRRGEDPDYPDWASFTAPTTANPFIPAEEIAERQRELPENVFRQEYLAEFVDWNSDENAFFDAATLSGDARQPDTLLSIGVDVARFGNDETVIAGVARNGAISILHTLRKSPITTIAELVLSQYRQQRIVVDDAGLGGGLTDILRKEKLNVEAFNGAESAIRDGQFANLRAESYWVLAEHLRYRDVALPDDRKLKDELSALRYAYQRGRILLEPKDAVRQRLGRSPDRADAVCYAVWGWRPRKPQYRTEFSYLPR